MKMSDRIDRAFSPGRKSTTVQKGIIRQKSTAGYIVETTAGVKIRAESVSTYAVGDWVTVLQGRILGRTGSGKLRKVFDI